VAFCKGAYYLLVDFIVINPSLNTVLRASSAIERESAMRVDPTSTRKDVVTLNQHSGVRSMQTCLHLSVIWGIKTVQ